MHSLARRHHIFVLCLFYSQDNFAQFYCIILTVNIHVHTEHH